MTFGNLTNDLGYQARGIQWLIQPLLSEQTDIEAFSKLFIYYKKWYTMLSKREKDPFRIKIDLPGHNCLNCVKKALMITNNIEEIIKWMKLGFACELNSRLNKKYQDILYEYLPADKKEEFHFSFWNNPNWETDYCIAIRKNNHENKLGWLGDYWEKGIIATAGFWVLGSHLAIIEKIQGKKAVLQPIQELIGWRWEFALVKALERLASIYGIKTLLIRPGEYNRWYYLAESDLKRRMNGTAKRMGYKRIAIADGKKAFAKSLSGNLPDLSNFRFPPLRDPEYDIIPRVKKRWGKDEQTIG